MNVTQFVSKFTSNGWKNENLTTLPDYSLFRGAECIVSYDNRINVQYHPKYGYIRIIISGKHNTLVTDRFGFISVAAIDDSIGVQVSYNENLLQVIETILSNTNKLIVKNWISIPNLFASFANASVLAIEQFLDQKEYVRSLGRQSPEFIAGNVLDQSNEYCGDGKFGSAWQLTIAHIKNEGLVNIPMLNNAIYISTSKVGVKISTEDQNLLIDTALNYLNKTTELSDEESADQFFICRLGVMLIQSGRHFDCVKAVQRYLEIGGAPDSDMLMNYTHSVGRVDDKNLKKKVLADALNIFENSPHLFSKEDTSYLYNSDNIAVLAARVDDKSTMLKYLSESKKLDPDFIKNNKTEKAFEKYQNDPDFLALFK